MLSCQLPPLRAEGSNKRGNSINSPNNNPGVCIRQLADTYMQQGSECKKSKSSYFGFQELRRHRPDAPPVILCGCGSDLRSDPATQARLAKTGSSPVSPEQALAVCCEIGAVNYVETSSKDNSSDEVSEAFEVSCHH